MLGQAAGKQFSVSTHRTLRVVAFRRHRYGVTQRAPWSCWMVSQLLTQSQNPVSSAVTELAENWLGAQRSPHLASYLRKAVFLEVATQYPSKCFW